MKNLLVISLALLSFAATAQKVKEKKDVWYVDGVAYLNQSCKNILIPPCVFSSPSNGKKHFSISAYPYLKRVKVNKGGNVWVEEDKKAYYFHIKFLDTDHEFYTRQYTKKTVKEIYNAGVITAAGEVDIAKLEDFIKVYGEDRPVNSDLH